MQKKLFLLDGMALVYRAHFAFIRRPIFTSKGVNTSALYGFTLTLLDVLTHQQPTHVGVAFDSAAPTQRHKDFAQYKEHREAMPEDIAIALPHIGRLLEAFRIPAIELDGYEADDIIGTLARQAEAQGFTAYMVTADKDFGQLVSDKVFLYKPSHMGSDVELLGVPEILEKWGVERPEQVIDVLALWGDATDNIPGVPGIGEKTAAKLIAKYGTVENALAHASELKGKLAENLIQHREHALLSKSLATICCDVPIETDLDNLRLQAFDEERLKQIFTEFEFNSLGRRLFGPEFRAGRGALAGADEAVALAKAEQGRLELATPPVGAPTPAALRTIDQVAPKYRILRSAEEQGAFLKALEQQSAFAMTAPVLGGDPRRDSCAGLAFCFQKGEAAFWPAQAGSEDEERLFEAVRSTLESGRTTKIGCQLKADFAVLRRQEIRLAGPFFDITVAHGVLEPELRHSLEYIAESFLGYTPIAAAKKSVKKPAAALAPEESEENPTLPHADEATRGAHDPATPGAADHSPQSERGALATGNSWEALARAAMEKADLAWQLRPLFEKSLKEKGQERVFYEIEMPLLPALAAMECEGIRIDGGALGEFARHLEKEMARSEKEIHRMAGRAFNLNSPRQLGEVLFDELRLAEKPKKTKTGQYSTNEQTLLALAADHEIARRILEYRAAAKLKSTYVDALPALISPKSGRVHTTYLQTATATGRLASINPNLQNIPIRSELGQEIRRAFVPRSPEFLLLSADYSQIELRIIASLSGDPAMIQAFHEGHDIHAATAARVFNAPLEAVTPEMRRQAKMVNFGIAYGISSFGLSQRLGISRQESAAIIHQYFLKYPGIKNYMEQTIAFARQRGYTQTMTGRRRYIHDISSSNGVLRAAAERNAINAPIQGTAADMIKIAMARIQQEIVRRNWRTRMLLQVHDELVFDLFTLEMEEATAVVREQMADALPLAVPVVVEAGTGKNWLEAH